MPTKKPAKGKAKTVAADAPKKPATRAKVMDVTHPGKTTPATTSRPVIVGHKPMVQDPMMSQPNNTAPKTDEAKITVTRGAKTIAPLTTAEKPADETVAVQLPPAPEPEPKPDAVSPPAVPEPTPETTPSLEVSDEVKAQMSDHEPQPEPAKETPPPAEEPQPASDPEAPKSDEASEVDAVAEQAGAGKKTPVLTEAEKQKQQEVQGLIDGKKYVVTVGQVTKKRRARGTLIFLVVLLLILVASWYVIDAGYVDPGFRLPVDFIKN